MTSYRPILFRLAPYGWDPVTKRKIICLAHNFGVWAASDGPTGAIHRRGWPQS